MFGFLRRRQPPQPQVWLIRSDGTPWAKAVLWRPPNLPWHNLLGPFRSEPDAEQTADHLNAERDGCLFYDAGNTGDDDDAFETPDDDDGDGWKRATE